jgi:hypothetical protein
MYLVEMAPGSPPRGVRASWSLQTPLQTQVPLVGVFSGSQWLRVMHTASLVVSQIAPPPYHISPGLEGHKRKDTTARQSGTTMAVSGLSQGG